MDDQFYRRVERNLRRLREERRLHPQEDVFSPSPSATYGPEDDPAVHLDGDEGGSCTVADGEGSDLSDETGHRGGDQYYSLPGWTGIDCLDVIEGLGLNFHLGNVLKYVWRSGRKSHDRLQDLEKAREYLDREISRLRGR